MVVYKAVNTISGSTYYGISKNFKKRKSSHRKNSKECNKGKRGCKTPFYDAVRSYGWNKFEWFILFEGDVKECEEMEINLIASDNNCYNLHKGGHTGYDVTTKSKEEVEQWKNKLKEARKGRTPAKGMQHTEENKKLFKEMSIMYWNSVKTYDWCEIKHLTHKEAKEQFGISTTHYYRLKNKNKQV